MCSQSPTRPAQFLPANREGDRQAWGLRADSLARGHTRELPLFVGHGLFPRCPLRMILFPIGRITISTSASGNPSRPQRAAALCQGLPRRQHNSSFSPIYGLPRCGTMRAGGIFRRGKGGGFPGTARTSPRPLEGPKNPKRCGSLFPSQSSLAVSRTRRPICRIPFTRGQARTCQAYNLLYRHVRRRGDIPDAPGIILCLWPRGRQRRRTLP